MNIEEIRKVQDERREEKLKSLGWLEERYKSYNRGINI